jgi:hypothetical protein
MYVMLGLVSKMPEEPRPFALIPMEDLSEMLNPNSDKMMRLLGKHIPREMLTADRAQEVFNALKREAEIRERDQVYFPLPDEQPLNQQSMFRTETKFSPKFQDIMTGEPMNLAWRLLKEYDIEDVKRLLVGEGAHRDWIERNAKKLQPGSNRDLPRPHALLSHKELRELEAQMQYDPNSYYEGEEKEYTDPQTGEVKTYRESFFKPHFQEVRDEIDLRELENTPWELPAPQTFNFLGGESKPSSTTSFTTDMSFGEPSTLESIEGKKNRGFQDIYTGEPMDIAFQLLKEDSLDPEERTPIKDEKVNYKFPSAGPYWTLNDRQKRIADAVIDLPSEYLSEEGWDGYDFDHLFAEGHETVPDQEYDRLEAALRYFKTYIKNHMAHPDTDKSPKFLESWDDPRHPWAMARHMAFYRDTEPYDHFSEDFKEANKSEPMDLAFDAIKKNLNRWFKEKWVDVSRKDKDGKHPPCGRSKAKKSSKGYPKCRPSVKVSSKTPKTSGSMTEGQKAAATKRKRSKKQGVGGKPTIVKEDFLSDPMSDFNMMVALQDEAYKLAELNTPYSREKYPEYDDYVEEIEYQGENILMQMMNKPEYAHLRERYKQSIPVMTETDEFPQDFINANKGSPIEIAFRLLKAPRIPRKKGQPAGSKKHSDLYTDENPKGTIHGLGFKNPAKARQSVSKIKNSSRSHAHKTQAAIAMEQRAREMGKKQEAGVYRNFIEQQKKKTQNMKKMVGVKQ